MQARLLPFLSLLALAACSESPYKQAKSDLMDSKSDYKECLEDNDGNESKCSAQKTNYETDRDALKQLK